MKKTIAILGLAVVGFTAVNANAGIHFGINLGLPIPAPVFVAPPPVFVQPPMPAPIVEAVTVCPTPGYIWVGGSWGWCDNHWVWSRGHWGPPVHWDRDGRWDRDGHRDHGFRAERHDDFRGGFRGGSHGESHGGFRAEHGRR